MVNAVVGRVLLMPKGNYSADITYNMLDWVRHDNESWVCKQTCVGQIPQAGDYWQLMASDGAEGGYCYIRYSENSDGTDFVTTPSANTDYVGFYTGDSDVAPTDKADYTWSKFIGEDGTSGKDGNLNYYGTLIIGNSTTPTVYQTGIEYANINDSYTNTNTFFEYRCVLAGEEAVAKWVYVGSKKGADGLGSGDMLKATYDVNNNGIVDNAEKLGGELPSYYLYTLPKGGDNLGGVKNGGNVTIDAEGNMNADVGAGTWSDLSNKPFSTVGTDGLKIASNTLDVDLTKVQSILADATTSASGKMSAADKTKLNGIATGANNYSLPTASASTKGGVKVGEGLTISSEVLSANVKGLINNKTDFDAQTVSTSQAVDSLLVKEILDDMNGIALIGTLAIGATSITFTDDMIVTGNTIKCDYYTDVYGISPTEVTISTGSMTLTFSAQTVDVGVRVEIREV